MGEQTTVSPQAMAWVGHEYQPRTVVIREDDIRRFVYSTRESMEDLEASGLRDDHGNLCAPPMFYVYLRNLPFQTVPLDQLSEDGYASEEMPPLPVTRGMAGEIDAEFGRPIHAGDEVIVRKRITGIEEKSGRSGPFVLVTFETEMVSRSGEFLARERFQRVMR